MHPELCKRLVQAQLKEALDTEGLFSEKVEMVESGYPLFYVRFVNVQGVQRLIRFDCTNYDFLPIAIEPVDPVSRLPLLPQGWISRDGGAFPSHHMKGGGQFLCITGTRDFYTHEGHKPEVTGERWDKRRADFKIADLIAALKKRFASGGWL